MDPPRFTTLYFGFASNLSPRSLSQRCPGSIYVGLARLSGWRFIISSLGFGNVVPGDPDSDHVYGTLHFLTAQHEAALDISEEVPKYQQKRQFTVTRVPAKGVDFGDDGQDLRVTTYVDVERTSEGQISKEYIFLMRKAMKDGLEIGVPQEYFQKYWEKFLPDDGIDATWGDEKIIMQRTIKVDREDLRFVPRELLKDRK